VSDVEERVPEAAPRVSVIIATYNRSQLLGEALESLRAQTFTGFEAIVVDDGSTDGTRDVVESFDDRFRYVQQPNCGRSRARNRGLELARGRYVAFLDDDDLLRPNKLEIQVASLDGDPDVDWVYSSARNVDAEGRPSHYPDYPAVESGWIYPRCVLYVPLTVILPTVLVRREILDVVGGFDERMDRFEDTDMWRRIAKRYAVKAISDTLVDVRAHEGNRMEDPREVFQSVSYYVGKVFREDGDVSPSLLRRRASGLFLHYGLAVWSRKEIRRLSRPFLRCALSCRCTNVYAAELLASTYVGIWVLRPHGYYDRVVSLLRADAHRS
jgi:glycosyltransferase involved in cell wall biosynthesis